MSNRTCSSCEKTLDIENFYRRGDKGYNTQCKQCMTIRRNDDIEYEIYKLNLKSKKWQAGKPQGCIRERININGSISYDVLHVVNGKQVSKTFYDKDDPNQAYLDAKQYRYEYSTKLGLTQNMIKVFKIDDNYFIKVKLNYGRVMVTNFEFSDIVQKYMIYTTSARKGSIRCLICIDGTKKTFHNYITGYKVTNHINGDKLDNRLCNLEKIQ